MPSSESTRFTVKFRRLTTRFLEEVTRKVWLILPSREPLTWHPRSEQRLSTEPNPPELRTIYRFCAAAGVARATVKTSAIIQMLRLRFIGWVPSQFLLLPNRPQI